MLPTNMTINDCFRYHKNLLTEDDIQEALDTLIDEQDISISMQNDLDIIEDDKKPELLKLMKDFKTKINSLINIYKIDFTLEDKTELNDFYDSIISCIEDL